MTTSEKPARPRNVTLKDVAALAGVSIATASKALNGRGYVHPQTRERVVEAAKKVSFTPNSLARGLLAGRTGTVGLLTNDLVGRFSIPVLMGAEDAFGTGKMSVLLCDARGDAIRESYHLQALLARRVDGLIVVGSSTDPRPSLGHDLPVPVVYAYGPSQDPRDVSVVPDNVAGAALAIDHLLSLGRRNIAHITGQEGYLAAQDRAAGASKRLAEEGLALAGGRVLYGDWSEAWGRSAASALIEQNPTVDAIFCGNDQIARGAIDAIRDRGLSVPGDVAVIGFDDWQVVTTGSRPQLSSIDMDLETLGRTAAQRLFAAIDGSEGSGVEHLPCRLVVRGSTMDGA
ncbi:LacI family DNA-binding transcriptional regulator [Paenarthrobacter sp. DKR-5]|uniref:LacI family DNA-binding transcriptional regulator n=1 Tax=Paenarthrobacter sp. DKR-5 TaxID=2835535 RepID=UPI0027DC5680|nr:LacI family DNA-binding transcriptional regulator [Paenarthrobacter sp. DKR-5]